MAWLGVFYFFVGFFLYEIKKSKITFSLINIIHKYLVDDGSFKKENDVCFI